MRFIKTVGFAGFLGMGSLIACAEQNTESGAGTLAGAESVEEAGEAAPGGDGSLVLNEVVAKAVAGGPDWVEFYNGGGVPADITGFALEDAAGNRFVFEKTTVLPPGAFWVLEGEGSEQEVAFTFGLGAEDQIRLFDGQGTLVDELTWEDGDAPEGKAFGRYPDGGDSVGTLVYPTFQAPNAPLEPVGGTEGLTEEGTAEEGDSGEVSIRVNEVSVEDPEGGNDWIEIHNGGSISVALGGWLIRDDQEDHVYALPEGTAVAPGEFLVVELDEAVGFGLGAADSAVLLTPTGEEVSSLVWQEGDAPAGRTYGRFPDGSDSLGTLVTPTPGEPNSGLYSEGGAGGEEGTEGGDPGLALRISEVMFNPDAVDDGDGEWFEVFNAGTVPIDLMGVEIGDDSGEFEWPGEGESQVVQPGEFGLFVRNSDAAVNGGIVPDGAPFATFTFALGNDGDAVIVRVEGLELDRFEYGEYASEKGKSLQQSPATLTALSTGAMEGDWCLAEAPYGAGDFGSPGVANGPCETTAETSGGEEGAEGGNGNWGPVTALVITEFMVNPAVADDNAGEWIEITNVGSLPVPLNGLMLGDSGGDISIDEDVVVPGDSSVVLARSADPTLNGGLENVVFVTSGLALNNGSDSVVLRAIDGSVLDRIDYDEASGWDLAAGVALQLNPSVAMGPGEHNDPAFWCPATTPYGGGDLGSPGSFNPGCDGGSESGGGTNPETGGESGGEMPVEVIGKVYVNEMMPTKGDTTGWVELFYSGSADRNLEGWALKNGAGGLFLFPAGIVIEGPGFLQVTEETLGFPLSQGEGIQLSDPLAELVDVLAPGNVTLSEGVSYGRYPDGATQSGALSAATPGAANSDFLTGPETIDHICNANCGQLYVGELGCFCDNLCYTYGDCCSASGTQYSDGCSGSACEDCQPPAPCCTAGTCGSTACEACVCAVYPSCCSGVWDASCSALANAGCASDCSCN